MPHERLRPSFVFDEEKIKQLQQIVPEAFADGNINWEVLKESLGERLEEEVAEAEHFGLFWPGKREARKIASIPSKGALIPVKGEGVNEDETKNIFIEGENLEVLKLLQKSYAGKIKMIYIDPPYNTGNEFIYDDNFTEPLAEYLKYTGQMDEEGKLLTTNKRADGRFHSKWLSMMYPRLRLARNLLQDEGVIFISIDDNESADLRKLCDEIFGEENFIACCVRRRRKSQANLSQNISAIHEYLLCYAKNMQRNLNKITTTIDKNKYSNPDNDPRGSYVTMPCSNKGGAKYEVITTTKKKYIDEWRFKEDTYKKLLADNRIVFPDSGNGKPRYKLFLKEKMEEGVIPNTWWDNLASNQEATAELKELFDSKNVFDNPKPVGLIKEVIRLGGGPKEIVLDFFAGSGTAAHATLDLNVEDLQNRKYILVQLQEQIEPESDAYKAGFKTISELCKERIRRAIKLIKKPEKKEGDFGFKVYKLEKSNFKQWQDYKGKDPKELTSLFKEHEIPLIDGWKPENLLIEVMLQEGFPLDSETIELKEFKKNTVLQIKSEFCEHKLLVCFDNKIYQETINVLNIQGEDIFVCLDSALSDEQKITLSDKGFLKTI